MLMVGAILSTSICLLAPFLGAPWEDKPRSAVHIIEDVMRVEDAQRSRLGRYSVVRKYVVKNAHLKGEAVLRVRWDYEPGKGKQFQVISNQGASGLTRISLMKLLKTEAADSHQKVNPSRISPGHYVLKLIGEGDTDYQLSLTPRKKSRYLLNGRAIVKKEGPAILRVEGRTSKRVSFWVSESDIIQEFADYSGFWMPRRTFSRVHIRLAGTTELTIESEEYVFAALVDGVK